LVARWLFVASVWSVWSVCSHLLRHFLFGVSQILLDVLDTAHEISGHVMHAG
jgi:hypothetical protein